MNGLLAIGVILMLGLFSWLAIQWFMAPVLSGSRHYDFGLVNISSEGPAYITHSFRLENNSGRPLSIKRAIPSCGCTSVDYYDPEVPVDGIVEIPVIMKFKRSSVERSKVTLTFEEASPMTLHVEGVGRLDNPLIIDPPMIRIRVGESQPVSLTIQFWEDGPIEYPVVVPFEGITVTEGRWKKMRQFKSDTGVPGLMRMTCQISLPKEFPLSKITLDIELGERTYTLPVMINPSIGRERDMGSNGQPARVYDPLKRTMLQENPEDEAPSVVGTNSSAIPSR